jgi:hypothetical protein
MVVSYHQVRQMLSKLSLDQLRTLAGEHNINHRGLTEHQLIDKLLHNQKGGSDKQVGGNALGDVLNWLHQIPRYRNLTLSDLLQLQSIDLRDISLGEIFSPESETLYADKDVPDLPQSLGELTHLRSVHLPESWGCDNVSLPVSLVKIPNLTLTPKCFQEQLTRMRQEKEQAPMPQLVQGPLTPAEESYVRMASEYPNNPAQRRAHLREMYWRYCFEKQNPDAIKGMARVLNVNMIGRKRDEVCRDIRGQIEAINVVPK